MAGRQIRWASLGRVGAIAAAVAAAIVSLPALLGGERPPPVPADVGLVQQAPAETLAPPLAASPVEAPPEPPVAAKRKTRLGNGETPGRERRRSGRRHGQSGREQRQSRHRDRRGAARAEQVLAPVPTYVPAPAYSLPQPGEFRFER